MLPASIAQAAAKLRAGELSCLALAEHCLNRIQAAQPKLKAFAAVTADQALATARERDA
jgi:Asp-tRNA(Asn)/Glu-tRNA(Gln) amidotransferase A subunit family amidase